MKPCVPGDTLVLPRASFLLYRDPRNRWSSQVNKVPRPTLLTCLATRDFPYWNDADHGTTWLLVALEPDRVGWLSWGSMWTLLKRVP